MKIGILVYSQTGNTLSVVEKIEQQLKAKGHEVQVEKLKVSGTGGDPSKMQLEAIPQVEGYDGLVVASPVQAFSLAQPMVKCLSGCGNLTGKRVALVTTQQLSKPWLGGNHAIRQMKTACEAKGGIVSASAIVNWSSKKRDEMIGLAVENTCKPFA